MRKNYLVLSCVAAGALVVSIACLSGCGKKPEAEKPRPVDYKPLFPVGSSVMAYQDLAAVNTNAVVRDINNAVTGKIHQVFSILQRQIPGTNLLASDFQKEYAECDQRLLEMTGLQKKDFNWLAFSIGEIEITTNLFAGKIEMPDVAAVLYSDKPIDPVSFTEAIRSLVCDSIREEMKEADDTIAPAAIEEKLDELRDVASLEKTQWKGRPAMKLVFKEPEVTNFIGRLSPILAQIGDGRLLALAGCEETLEILEALYAGTSQPRAVDSVLAQAIDGTGGVYSAFTLAKIDRLVADLLPAGAPVPTEMASVLPFIKGLRAIHGVQGTDGDSCFAEYSGVFNDPQLASTLSSQAPMAKSAAGGLIALAVPELSLQTAAMKFIYKIVISADGGTFKIRFAISPSLVDGIDAAALLKIYLSNMPSPEEPDVIDEVEEESAEEAK